MSDTVRTGISAGFSDYGTPYETLYWDNAYGRGRGKRSRNVTQKRGMHLPSTLWTEK